MCLGLGLLYRSRLLKIGYSFAVTLWNTNDTVIHQIIAVRRKFKTSTMERVIVLAICLLLNALCIPLEL
jgi:hypothetical protein